MICCLNPFCENPSVEDSINLCPECGAPLELLKNRYRPVTPLGGGGFSKTYLAEDIDKLNEKCVIKQFAPQAQGTAGLQKAIELFKLEAVRLQQLAEHPQIPTLLGYFQEDSNLYLVQQFIDGQNLLDELQQQGNFNETKVRKLLKDLLNVLCEVHRHNIIHRDIKPENIIRDRDGKIILIDFGASKLLTQAVATKQGTIVGSFGYAPLEQTQSGTVYPASDLYNLGATCFHLLSGVHPWELWKSQGYGWVENWWTHVEQSITLELRDIIDKLLQENYSQRYQSAEEVLQDLNSQSVSFLLNSPIPTSNPSAQPTQLSVINRFSNFKKLTRVSVVAGVASLMLIGGGAIYFARSVNTETEQITFEQLEKAKAHYEQGIANDNKQDYSSAVESFSQAINFGDDSLKAKAYERRGLALGNQNRIDQAKSNFRKAQELYIELGKPGDAERCNGFELYLSGEYKKAIPAFEKAISLNKNDFDSYRRLGDVYRNATNELKDYDKAIENYDQAININDKDFYAFNNRGLAYEQKDEKDKAIKDYEKAIDLNPNSSETYSNLGNIHFEKNEYKEAIKNYDQAIRINPERRQYHYNRGYAYWNLSKFPEAIENFEKEIDLNPEYLNAYIYLAKVLAYTGDEQEAIKTLDRGERKITNPTGWFFYERATIHMDLGNKSQAIKDFDRAAKLYSTAGQTIYAKNSTAYSLVLSGDNARAISVSSEAIGSEKTSESYMIRGLAYMNLNNYSQAIEDFTKVININSNYAEAFLNRGIARGKLGDKTGALKDLHEAAQKYEKRGKDIYYQQAKNLIAKLN